MGPPVATPDSTVRRPPGPKGLPLLGCLLEFRKDPIGFVTSLGPRYGDIVYYKVGAIHVYFLRHPDQIRDVLVTHQHEFTKGEGLKWAKNFLGEGLLTSEGELHTRQRRLSQPAFHRQRISSYAGVVVEHAVRTRDRWQNRATVDMAQEMMALTLAIVGKALFDADLEGEAAEIGRSLTTIIKLFSRFTIPYASVLQRLPLPSTIGFLRARSRLDATIYRTIEERRRGGVDRGDLLSMLLLAQDEEGGTGRMTDLQLRDEAMTLFLAGHETTANALAWTWYLLSQNPSAEARLHREIDQVLAGRLPTYEDVPKLPYTERILAESMRLYPPAWGIGRRSLKDYAVDGYTIPPGSLVHLSPLATHRDPRWFPDPLAFEPDRWLPEAKAARPKFSYFPFGGGARQCIGEPFAWLEGILLIATLAQEWRMHLEPSHRVEPQALITLRPRNGIRMTLERRASTG